MLVKSYVNFAKISEIYLKNGLSSGLMPIFIPCFIHNCVFLAYLFSFIDKI